MSERSPKFVTSMTALSALPMAALSLPPTVASMMHVGSGTVPTVLRVYEKQSSQRCKGKVTGVAFVATRYMQSCAPTLASLSQ